MKEYQIRTADLKNILLPGIEFYIGDSGATTIYDRWMRQAHTLAIGAKLVLAEWETEAEADKARLDWLESLKLNSFREYLTFLYASHNEGQTVRNVIDLARNAPAPKVTVISEGGKSC